MKREDTSFNFSLKPHRTQNWEIKNIWNYFLTSKSQGDKKKDCIIVE